MPSRKPKAPKTGGRRKGRWLFEFWSRPGFGLVGLNRVAWFVPFRLAVWAVLIALMWKRNSWARTMIIVAIAWYAVQTITKATMLFAIGGGLPAWLSWGNLAVELFAVYLLLQSESLDWFRRR